MEQWIPVPGANGYRLPRGAEWEHACRAGTSTACACGDYEKLLSKYCQYMPSKLTSICGEKLPNGWGLHDLHGNVSEWCEEPLDQQSFETVAMRGCSWNRGAEYCRSDVASGMDGLLRYNECGFRVALSIANGPTEQGKSSEVQP